MLSQIRSFLFFFSLEKLKKKEKKLKSNLLISCFSAVCMRKSCLASLSPSTPSEHHPTPNPTSHSAHHESSTPQSPFASHSSRPAPSLTAPWTPRTCCAAWRPSSPRTLLWCPLGCCTRPCRAAGLLRCGRTSRAWSRCGSGCRHCVAGSSSDC